MTHAERSSIMDMSLDMDVTLDGRPATISGRLLRFAIVSALDGSQLGAEFSWETVARKVRAGRATGRADFHATLNR